MPADQGSLRAPFSLAERRTWTLHVDAGASPNPGRMALGAHLSAPDGQTFSLSRILPGTGCNNEAEIRAVIEALRWAMTLGAQAPLIYTDSRIVVDHATSDSAAPPARLQPIFEQLEQALRESVGSTLWWIPRHRNGLADALAREALGLPPKVCAVPQGARRKRR